MYNWHRIYSFFLTAQQRIRLPLHKLAKPIMLFTRTEADPSLLKLLMKMLQKLNLIFTCQNTLPSLFCQLDHLLNSHTIPIDQPRTYHQQSPPPTRVAVNTDPPSISERHIEKIHDPHHMFKSSTRHIFPTLVKTMNSMSVEMFRNVAEPYIRNNAITTVWMFSWFLQIQHSTDPLRFEFLVNIELLYQSLGRSLHS